MHKRFTCQPEADKPQEGSPIRYARLEHLSVSAIQPRWNGIQIPLDKISTAQTLFL